MLKLDFYAPDDIQKILSNNCKILEINLSPASMKIVAEKSRGTPRISNRLLEIVRDHHTIGKHVADKDVLENIFTDIGIDER